MPAGEVFTVDQRRGIERARVDAERASGLTFHVRVGACDGDPRPVAQRIHAQLPEPHSAVLLMVDPSARALEVVTGTQAASVLNDSACSLVALSMQTAFAAGDLAGGIVHGLYQLGDHAHRPDSMHTRPH